MFLLGLWAKGARLGSLRLIAAAALLALSLSALNLATTSPTKPASADSGSGLFVFGSTTGISFSSPHSAGGNYLIKWSSLQPDENTYSWNSLDAALGRAESAGKKIILRVYSNWSSFGQGTPAWFFEQDGARHYYPATTAQTRNYKSPVPWDSVFQAEFGDFVRALGQRYNGHQAIEFIQITGIGVYGEVYLGQVKPSDFSASKHLSAAKYWIDTWRAAFPDTNLALMVNGIGHNIGENAANHALTRGYYLQANNHKNTVATRAIIAAHDEETKIAIEAENGGCQTATLAEGFEGQMAETFSLGYEIDYLALCYETFADEATARILPSVAARLRSSGGGSGGTTEPAATPTTQPSATATRTQTAAAPTATRTPAPTATPTRTQAPSPTPTRTPVAASADPTPTATPWWSRWGWWWR